MLIVTYGTLKKGQHNNHILKNAKLISGCAVRGFKLYYAGFPVASPSELETIRGEIWDIGDPDTDDDARDTLMRLDRLEGYHPENDNSMYFRDEVTAFADDGNTHTAHMYVGNPKYWSNFKGMRDCNVNEGFYTWG